MSFEILSEGGSTVYAPLNTTIDADRDYMDMQGLDACGCGQASALVPTGVSGFYEDEQLPQGMLGAAEGGSNTMLLVMGGLLAAWAWWAWRTPHEDYP
jgi:hypothetical protein